LSRLLFITIPFFLAGLNFPFQKGKEADLRNQDWIHGSQDCKTNQDALIQVVCYNATTWILRQNKCIHYEAPFIFLLVGKDQSLLVDTGATADEKKFPLRQVVDSILLANGINKKLVVVHTHSHGDHLAADRQFKKRDNTEVVGSSWDEIRKQFGFSESNLMSSMELGNRVINVLSVPGHDLTSLAFYDSKTNFLFTGDTFYPGRLYVREWTSFKKSIKRIVHFAEEKNVTQFIGNHIEMTNKNGIDYPVGSTFQPHEHVLPMTMAQLKELDSALDRLGDSPKLEVHDHFIIYPK